MSYTVALLTICKKKSLKLFPAGLAITTLTFTLFYV
jgi:hypothetical protein